MIKNGPKKGQKQAKNGSKNTKNSEIQSFFTLFEILNSRNLTHGHSVTKMSKSVKFVCFWKYDVKIMRGFLRGFWGCLRGCANLLLAYGGVTRICHENVTVCTIFTFWEISDVIFWCFLLFFEIRVCTKVYKLIFKANHRVTQIDKKWQKW